MPAQTGYASSNGVSIAYQVYGDGPVDIIWVPSFLNQVEHMWEEPSVARFIERIGSFARVILYDRRGTGLSDPLMGPPTIEAEVEDVKTLLDTVGSERAAVFAYNIGGPVAIAFATQYPERVQALVLYATQATAVHTEETPWAMKPEERRAVNEAMVADWGSAALVPILAPTLADDERFKQWFGRLQRLAVSPGTMLALMELLNTTDVRDLLCEITAPTLILHRTDDHFIDVRHSRYMAERIPGARLIELPGNDHIPTVGDSDGLLDQIEEFLTGKRGTVEPDRSLLTLLFTDIVDSTSHAATLGDRRWRDLLNDHDMLVRRELERFHGREIKSIGDGFLATFDSPTSAIRCASTIINGSRALGIELRAGLHTGECELIGDDVGGMAVHIAARVSSCAEPNQVLVTSTVRDLVTGSSLQFFDRGVRELKGVTEEWRLFAARVQTPREWIAGAPFAGSGFAFGS